MIADQIEQNYLNQSGSGLYIRKQAHGIQLKQLKLKFNIINCESIHSDGVYGYQQNNVSVGAKFVTLLGLCPFINCQQQANEIQVRGEKAIRYFKQ